MTRKPNPRTASRVGARTADAAIGLALAGAALIAFAFHASPAFGQDIGSSCAVFPGQTHSQIIRGVEGRLEGDWALAIKTTERSAKRIRDKGEDASQAVLFSQVLACLRDEIAAGQHADQVAAAKANPKPEPGTASNNRSQGGGGTAATTTATAVQTAPATQSGGIDTSALVPSTAGDTAAATNATTATGDGGGTALQSGGQSVVGSSGVALPGTAESYALNTGSGGTGQPQVAAVPSGGYAGQACNYFTRPLEEVINGIRHLNRYGEGEWVCHQDQMYACFSGAWEDMGTCAQYNNWQSRVSTQLEVYPR